MRSSTVKDISTKMMNFFVTWLISCSKNKTSSNMSSLAGQFARKVALFVKDEKVNASEFQLKSTEGDKIVMTDGDDLEVLVLV
jgi:hypothetical protein